MTEKRFIIADDYAILDSTQNNKIGKGIYVAQDPVEATKLCKLLNDLAKENQELKLLLREVEHELTTLTGLTATDSTSIVKEDMKKYCLFRLDYTELLKKIDKVIRND